MLGKRVVFIGICLIGGSLMPAAAQDKTALKVKPGLWEMTSDNETSGMPAIPAEALASLPPEQRAQIEAQLKQLRPPQHEVKKQCVTQKTLDRGFEKMEKMGEGNCTRTVVANTATLLEGRVQCKGAGNVSGSYRFEARTPEVVVATSDMTTSDGTHTMKMQHKTNGKWLDSNCGDVRPED